jgi:hypothetical protein
MEHDAHGDQRVMSTLIRHFFRRFFDNDTVHVQGDTVTTVVRALAAVAVPGLMVAFFLQNQYPRRPLWGAIEDQYLFVLLSFVVMGAVAIIEWEMLFPDRADFLVLTPLSLKRWQMLAAKAAALSGFLLLFLFGVNAFGTWLLPAVSKGDFFRQVWAHGVAVSLAGTFAALVLLGIGGLMLCVLDPRRFRLASPLLQMGTVAMLTLSLIQYLKYGDTIQAQLTEPLGWTRWYPPYWFLGVYETLLRGSSAPAFAGDLGRHAYLATAVAAVVVLVTYPMAWARMQRVAIDGVSGAGRKPWRWWSRVLELAVPRPAERAVFHFIGQTVARNARYQVYLAIYGGLGFALAVGCATEIQMTANGFRLSLSKNGLHAVLPLTLFWAVAGLRSAFSFPLNPGAVWIFRVSGAKAIECGVAARCWGLSFAWAVAGAVAAVTALADWSARQIFVQMVCGACLGVLLTDAFFASDEHVPFSRLRMPGRTNFPLMLTLYVAILPLYVMGMIRAELFLEKSLVALVMVALGTILIHVGAGRLRHEPEIVEEDLEGYDDDFQLLGLS